MLKLALLPIISRIYNPSVSSEQAHTALLRQTKAFPFRFPLRAENYIFIASVFLLRRRPAVAGLCVGGDEKSGKLPLYSPVLPLKIEPASLGFNFVLDCRQLPLHKGANKVCNSRKNCTNPLALPLAAPAGAFRSATAAGGS